jgi:hypothetical protein
MSLVNRNNIQKVETKFSIDLLLFGFGKQHKNAGLVYFDSLFAFTGRSNDVGEQKSFFNDSSIAEDTFIKSFGFDMGSNRRQTCIRKTF